MSNHVATLKRGAILASFVVSSYAVFGHDAWAPEPAMLTAPLSGSNGATAAAYSTDTFQPTTVLRWPGSWVFGPHAAGTPCSWVSLSAWTTANMFIQRHGPYIKCIPWVTEGARLTADLSGTGSTARATTLSTQQATTVVQFPMTWTYETTLAAETYCTTWPAPAGTAVGTIIVRSGDYAKCSS